MIVQQRCGVPRDFELFGFVEVYEIHHCRGLTACGFCIPHKTLSSMFPIIFSRRNERENEELREERLELLKTKVMY